MEKTLLYLLACPLCKGELHYTPEHDELVCCFDRLAFPIIDNVPVMIEARARRLSVDEVSEIKK
jgi:hypothetical protein